MRNRKTVIMILLSIIAIALMHYSTPVHSHHLHAIFQRFFYIPIILGALIFELWPGVLFAFFTALVYLPHILIQWNGMHNDVFTKLVEVAMMLIISVITGLLSQRFRLEEDRAKVALKQVAKMDRLALLGKLSAGLAHEIRNPLGSLVGSAEILEIELGIDHPQAPFVEILHSELKRLTDRLNEFLRFAKPVEPTVIPNSLETLVNSTVKLVEQDAKSFNIEIEIEHQPNAPLFEMDSEQLRQVLLNLLLNAIQQIKKDGEIKVSTFFNEREFGFSVLDSGGGFKDEVLSKIFEPFFTTKKSGTGLGLAIAFEIINKMNGRISAKNCGDGALFKVSVTYGK
jgi:two-component system sensor histidine kinase HydH